MPKPPSGAELASVQISNPFTQSWIQGLTLASDNPVARTIKPKLELIDHLSLNRPDVDRMAAAKDLWAFCETEGLGDVLSILPVCQASWVFDRDDVFLFGNNAPPPAKTFDVWCECLGLKTASFGLTAEVTSADWTVLVRGEAVRLQQSLNVAAVQQESTMHLPCTATWDTRSWSVKFDQLEWIVVKYEDAVMVSRPEFSELRDQLIWLMAAANESVVAKKAATSGFEFQQQAWFRCVAGLRPLHELIFNEANTFSPWFTRTWNCVWPVVYREQNVLKGLADVSQVRNEIKACLISQPRLTLWMFVFAKLLCQIQSGTGLGFCADYRD